VLLVEVVVVLLLLLLRMLLMLLLLLLVVVVVVMVVLLVVEMVLFSLDRQAAEVIGFRRHLNGTESCEAHARTRCSSEKST